MRKIIVVFAFALIFVSVANANGWYQSRGNMQKNIATKYYASNVKCVPWKYAQSFKDTWSVNYTAFDCVMYSTATNHTCWVIAHQVGRLWNSIVLTTSPPGGCTSRDIVIK